MNEDTTVLDYIVLPDKVFYTRDAYNPSIAIITIGASNTTEDNVKIVGFKVQLPVSSNVEDPYALTSNPSSITPVSLQPLTWDFQQIDDGIYLASPIDVTTVIKPGESITFQLQSVTVNQAPGTSNILITERIESDFRTVNIQIAKVKSKLDIKSFLATPDHIKSGDASILSWETEGAARVTLIPGSFPDIKPNDSITVKPGKSITYTLTAFGEGPNISRQEIVSILSPEILRFISSADKVNAGDKVTLSWEVNNADYISISPGNYINLQPKGSLEVIIWNETNFILTASNNGNEYSNKTAPVGINPVVINSFQANPSYGARIGEAIVLSWDVKSAVSAVIQYGTINLIEQNNLNNGNLSIIPNTGVAYSLIAENSLGSAKKSIELLPMPLGWHQFTSNAPFGYSDLPLVLNFKSNMWVMASYGNKIYHSFDGSNWIPVVVSVPWQARSYCAGIIFHEKMWLMGGVTPTSSYLNDVWSSSDGITWTQENAAAPWTARKSFGCFTLPGIDKIFIVGGIDSTGKYLTDVWSSSDGKTWTQVTAQAFENGRCAFGIVTYNDTAWIMGGLVNGKPVNEVWYSKDGESWNIMTGIKWAARSYPVVGALSNGIYLSGGLDSFGKGIYDMNKMDYNKNWSGMSGYQFKDILNTAGVEYQDSLWFIGGSLQNGYANQNVWAFAP
jgi:hypothetical protein